MGMKTNIGSVDRVARLAVGVVLLAVAAAGLGGLVEVGTVVAGVAALVGIVLTGTAVARVCPLYSVLGVDTCSAT